MYQYKQQSLHPTMTELETKSHNIRYTRLQLSSHDATLTPFLSQYCLSSLPHRKSSSHFLHTLFENSSGPTPQPPSSVWLGYPGCTISSILLAVLGTLLSTVSKCSTVRLAVLLKFIKDSPMKASVDLVIEIYVIIQGVI